MMPFHVLCPETAAQAARCFLIPPGDPDIPAGEYTCIEFYCEDPRCDCRRVQLNVCAMTGNRPGPTLVTVNYGWESAAFYAAWLGADPATPDGRARGAEMAGAFIDTFANSPAKEGSALAEVVIDSVISDPVYVERLKERYVEFRSKLKRKPPLQWNLRRGKKRLR